MRCAIGSTGVSILSGVLRGQVFALLGVEHGVALEERDRAFGFLALVVGVGADDAVGIDDQLAMFALAHIAAERQSLAEGEPVRRLIAGDHRGHPQHDGVDALIGNAVVAQRAHDASFHVAGVPGPVPRPHALFEIGDDLSGDAAVKIAAGWCVGAASSALRCFVVMGIPLLPGRPPRVGPRCGPAGARGLGNGGARRGRGIARLAGRFAESRGYRRRGQRPCPGVPGCAPGSARFEALGGSIGSGKISRTNRAVRASDRRGRPYSMACLYCALRRNTAGLIPNLALCDGPGARDQQELRFDSIELRHVLVVWRKLPKAPTPARRDITRSSRDNSSVVRLH